MARSKKTITKRQQHWLDHIRAADTSADTLVTYAATHKLKVKDLYQITPLMTLRRMQLTRNTSHPTAELKAVVDRYQQTCRALKSSMSLTMKTAPATRASHHSK